MPELGVGDIGRLLEQFSGKLTASQFAQIMAKAAESVALRAEEMARDEYPPAPPHKGQGGALNTDKQRRWWWAMMHRIARAEAVPDNLRGWKATYKKVKGIKTLVISGGYKRTGTMVRSIGSRIRSDAYRVDVEVGPGLARVPTPAGIEEYAQYVIGPPPPEGNQARIHQGRWVPLYKLLESGGDELFEIFQEEFIALAQDFVRQNLS